MHPTIIYAYPRNKFLPPVNEVLDNIKLLVPPNPATGYSTKIY